MISAAKDLETFIRSEFGSQDKYNWHVIGGPAVSIHGRAISVLGSILDEIASLSAAVDQRDVDPGLAVHWFCDHQGHCVIELVDPAAHAKNRSSPSGGHCSPKQKAGLEQSGGGMIRCEMSGGAARVIVPARFLANRHAVEGWSDERSIDPLKDRSVLVVEDQLLIALDLESLLLEQGAAAVRLSGSVDDALQSIASERPDIAILDVNLGSTTSFPIAFELQRLGIPLIFATGYGNEVDFPSELRSVPLVAKPYCMETIREALLATSLVHA